MAKLTTAERKRIPAKDFALGSGRYPIEDASHARNALARVSQHGTPAEQATVREKVHEKYPGIGEGKGMEKKHEEKKGGGEKKHEGAKKAGAKKPGAMRSGGHMSGGRHMGHVEGHEAIGEQKGYCK